MSGSDKAEGKKDVAAGKVKETVGNAVGNERLQAEGRGDQAKGHATEAKEKAKDAIKDVFHRDKD
ncbi:CsbD-like [Actinacidiphila alni]|uniref:CsbD-like n=1 Tax=Actinacidiphila alni TaxID=380248 RepID=A0A1I2LDT2_9ACTN|nr:CsbD family protein [Actinacidiphila alni]SFF76650.1 CsbD-like [Actinacidiphila alni]